MNDDALERLLLRTAAAVAYPPAPDVSLRVVARVTSPPRKMAQPRFSPAYVVIAALLLLALALAVTPSREAIARLFGVEGSKIEVVPAPTQGASSVPQPTPQATPDFGLPLRVIRSVDPATLPSLAGFEAALPDAPDERLSSSLIFYGDQPVALHHYPNFDLWQTRMPQNASFGKMVEEDAILEEVTVNGQNGIWLSGRPHFVAYTLPDGRIVPGSNRTVEQSTLIWRTDAFFYRIETDLSLEQTLRIAETLP